MADPTAQFFEKLASRGHEPRLGQASGTIRFEVVEGSRVQRWHVSVRKGNVEVSRRNASADCVVRIERSLLERILRGEENATAALLRGAMNVEGSVGLLVLFQKLLPSPPRSRRRKKAQAP
jgi:putative sterol carrier protein